MYLISQIRNNCIKNVIVNVFLHINGVQHVTIEQQIQLQSSVKNNAKRVWRNCSNKRCLNIFIGDATIDTFWIFL